MLAGNWKTARMVAHYSAEATVERPAPVRVLEVVADDDSHRLVGPGHREEGDVPLTVEN